MDVSNAATTRTLGIPLPYWANFWRLQRLSHRHGYAAVCTSAARWLTGPRATVYRR